MVFRLEMYESFFTHAYIIIDFISSVSHSIDIIKYVIYGIASAFFVYGILLMVEGFFTSGAIKDLYGDFKITTCGRCVSAWVRNHWENFMHWNVEKGNDKATKSNCRT